MATTLDNSDSMTNFDWESYENNTEDKKYDEPLIYKQGIAIVRRNGKFGAIMVGGKEIVPSIYDELSEFKDGYAVAKWNGEERVINLSGQIRVLKGDKEIFLPEEYDWGYDFVESICVIVKIDENTLGEYGIISNDFKVLVEPFYNSCSGFNNGYCLLGLQGRNVFRKGLLVNAIGKICFYVQDKINDECLVVSNRNDGDGKYGLVNYCGDILVPLEYDSIKILGSLFVVANKRESNTILYNTKGKELRAIEGNIKFCNQKGAICFTNKGEEIFVDAEGVLYLSNMQQISEEYLKYFHERTSLYSFLKIKNDDQLWGISDTQGKVLISAKYNYISVLSKDRFIAAIVPGQEKILQFGVIDLNDSILLPFKYNRLVSLSDSYIAFTSDSKIHEQEQNNYYLGSPQKPIHGNVNTDYVWGVINSELSEICSPKYNVIEKILGKGLFVVYKNGYGIIDESGNEIVPTKFKDIKRSIKDNSLIVANHKYDPLYNKLDDNGCFIVYSSDQKKIAVPSTLVDWCSNFNKEKKYAEIIKNGYVGKINEQLKLVSLSDNELIEIPTNYELAYDFRFGFVPVMKNFKWGIANEHFELLIPCEYEYIEPICKDVFRYKENNLSGLIDIHGKTIIKAEFDNVNAIADDYFQLTKKSSWYGKTDSKLGIANKSGDILVPVLFSEIYQQNVNDSIFWIVSKKIEKEEVYNPYLIKKGVYCNGKIIVPVIFDEIKFNDNMFECAHKEEKDIETITKYNIKGEVVLRDNFFVPSEYSLALESTIGLFRVMKDSKWGIMNQKKELIVSNVYAYIHDFKGCYAIVEKGEYISYFGEGFLDYKTNKQIGLIDTTGEEVLAIEYEHLWQYDNECILAKKEGLYGVLSPSLNWIVTPQFHRITMLGNTHFVAVVDGENKLFDYSGHEIPLDDFDEIEILSNGFYKLTRIGRYNLMCVVNSQGKTIVDYDYYEDIKSLDNGLMLVTKRESQGIDLRDKTVYNFIDIQGEELFPIDYEEINFETSSILSVRYDRKWGLVDILGNIVAEPNYNYKLDFNQGVSSVNVDASPYSQKINLNGEIIVVNENTGNEVILSNEYYWGTNFINDLCIVRSRCQHVGVIELNGKIVIPTQYKTIHILSNNVIVAKNENNNWGVFNGNGSVIMDFVYDLIEPQENSFYAIVKKGKTYGIANIEMNDIVLFDELKIKYMWNLDKFGRCLYSENCVFDLGAETWEGGTTGLIDMNGIIVPADEYDYIYSVDENVVTAIYENGEEESYKKHEDEDGEVWLLKTDEIIKSDGDEIQNSYKEKETSVIILSDEIPKSRSNGYGDWFHHDDSYDDCSSRYGGYNGYDDDTIDSAFEGNPELTWNID